MTPTLESLKHLSFDEKLQLVHDLWNSIAADAQAAELSDEQKRLIDERIAAYEANPRSGSSWAEVRARIENS